MKTPEKKLAYITLWQSKNKDRVREYAIKSRKTNHEKQITHARKMRKTHPEKQAEYRRRWRSKNRDQFNAMERLRYHKNGDKRRAKSRAYMKSHPEKNRNAAHIRRVRAGAVAMEEKARCEAFIKNVRLRRFVPCYYCGEKTPGKDCHIDHVVPLAGKSKKGTHSIDNLCASCPDCNLGKRNKTDWQPVKSNQQVLHL